VKVLNADLHIHTCLSPCAERTMLPSAVVSAARKRGLNMIAICDHNSAENAAPFRRVGEAAELIVIGGMEITSREEVHLLALFPDDESAAEMQDEVYAHLPGKNDSELFGKQWVVNDDDRIVAENPRLLIGATELTLNEIADRVHEHGGIVIASHVERPSFSLLSQLGFIPNDLPLDGLETCEDVRTDWGSELAVIRSSDAHRLHEIGNRYTEFLLEEGTLEEIAFALKGERGRRIVRTR
jgi:PHP family Zn ribbon phosphoesterase